MGWQVGDMDLDGYMEVFFGNGGPPSGETNTIGSFVPTGDGGIRWEDRTALFDSPAAEDGFDPPYPPYPYRTHGAAFADFDGDGDSDLFVGNGGMTFSSLDEPNRLWRYDGPANHWLRVDLEGTASNRAGTGARVRVSDGPEVASTWAVYRHTFQNSGFNSSHPRVITVGTGGCPGPYHVTVTWPSGNLQTVTDVAALTTLELTEDR